jgi:hypothetical protein
MLFVFILDCPFGRGLYLATGPLNRETRKRKNCCMKRAADLAVKKDEDCSPKNTPESLDPDR